MTEQESLKLLTEMYTLYSNKQVFKENMDEKDKRIYANTLKIHFSHFTGKQVHSALHELISSREPIYGFADLIGALKQKIISHITFPQPTFEQVWNVALRNCSCNYQTAKENFDRLPLFLKSVFGGTSFLVRLGEADSTKRDFIRKDLTESYEYQIDRQKEKYTVGQLSLPQMALENGLEKQFAELNSQKKGLIE